MLYEYCGEGESLPFFVSDSMHLHLEIEQFVWHLLADNVVPLLNRVVSVVATLPQHSVGFIQKLKRFHFSNFPTLGNFRMAVGAPIL